MRKRPPGEDNDLSANHKCHRYLCNINIYDTELKSSPMASLLTSSILSSKLHVRLSRGHCPYTEYFISSPKNRKILVYSLFDIANNIQVVCLSRRRHETELETGVITHDVACATGILKFQGRHNCCFILLMCFKTNDACV